MRKHGGRSRGYRVQIECKLHSKRMRQLGGPQRASRGACGRVAFRRLIVAPDRLRQASVKLGLESLRLICLIDPVDADAAPTRFATNARQGRTLRNGEAEPADTDGRAVPSLEVDVAAECDGPALRAVQSFDLEVRAVDLIVAGTTGRRAIRRYDRSRHG